MNKFNTIMEMYVPPCLGMLVGLPVIIGWWSLWVVVWLMIHLFIPFGRMDNILAKWDRFCPFA